MMESSNLGNISRASSIAISNANRQTTIDDRTIAQGLLSLQSLSPLQIPRRRSSVFGASPGHQTLDGLDSAHQVENVPVSALLKQPSSRRALITSNTWTSSDGEHVADQDEVDDRKLFVEEFNLLARKHGVRKIAVDGSEGFGDEFGDLSSKRDSWFSRKILRKTSSSHSVRAKTDRSLRHRRSISDLSLRLKMKKDKLKDKDLQELIVLCGSSRLYLPSEYAASTLCVPTCFRATAQYLVQHGTTTRGLFRIPGSQTKVAALYNHYCSMDEYGDVVAGTVRCPTLPDHIRCDVHDVASAFKKFISGLPGGILGSLALLDAFISIQSQLHGDPELTRTKQSKVRARLIALAISTSRSQYRRDLICAVFGLLSMIGRASETARREDHRGHPLPTSDLMGYGPLGIIFGPLLVGDLLEDYTMRLADPHGGLVLLPISPPKSRKERKKKILKSGDEGSAFNTHVDKIKVANSITEMLITHWRDVVRHMKHMDSIKHLASSQSFELTSSNQSFLRPSASASFAIRKPPDWEHVKLNHTRLDRSVSPTPRQRGAPIENQDENHLSVKKQRTKSRPKSLQQLSLARSLSILSPTMEEVSRSTELSSNSGSSCKETNHPSPIQHRAPEIEPSNFSNSSDKENELQRQKLHSSHPIVRRKPSGKIQQRVNIIEAQLSPSKDSLRPTPKKLIKPQATRESPNKVKWAVGDAATSKAANYSPKTSQLKRYERTGVSRLPIPQNSGPSSHKSIYYAPKFPHQPQKDQTSSTTTSGKPWPEIRILKATSRDDNENDELRAQRRIGGSEPGLQIATLSKTSRRMSKSLHEYSRRTRQLTDSSKLSKDPLTKVSQEEDIASLAALAEALTTVKDTDENKLEINLPELLSKSPQIQSVDVKPIGQPSALSQGFPESASSITHVPQPTSSPGSRVSTLVAKFNNGESASDLASRRPSSPSRSLRKPIEEDYLQPLDNPREKLVAQYMMNSPSPTKSQKSANSENTPKTIRSPVLFPRPNADLKRASTLPSTPRRFLRGSVHDSTPLRPVPRSLEYKTSSAAKSLNPFPVSPRPIQNSIVKLIATPTKESRRKSWRPLLDGNFSTMSDSASTRVSANERAYAIVDELSSKSRSSRDLLYQPTTGPISKFPTVNSPSNQTPSGKLLPSSKPPPVAQHVHFARPQSFSHEIVDFIPPDSPFTDSFPCSNPVSRVSTPGPVRSNSMLFNQVRTLQRQLSAKTEEARQLRKQLDARQNLDVGMLSEQLREAKREIDLWKTRAENYERQLQIFDRTRRRSHSSLKEPFALSVEQLNRSSTDHQVELPAVPGKSRSSLRDLDGARSTAGWNSEESCDTVIREIRENAITGSEYGLWAEQMNACEYMAPDD